MALRNTIIVIGEGFKIVRVAGPMSAERAEKGLFYLRTSAEHNGFAIPPPNRWYEAHHMHSLNHCIKQDAVFYGNGFSVQI